MSINIEKVCQNMSDLIIRGIQNQGRYSYDREEVNDHIPFSQKQIKSAHNKGTFDTNNPNIYWQPSYYPNKLRVENSVVDLTNELKKRPTEKQVKSFLNSLIGKELDTAFKPLQIMVTEENKGHIKGTNVNLKGGQETRHNATLIKLKDIVSNAIVDYSRDGTVDLSHNTKKETIEHKKGIEKYVYFNSEIKIGKEYFTVELHSELPKSRKNKNLYDLYHVRVRRNLPAASNDTLQSGGSHNYNISQSDTNVKFNLQ